LRLKFWKIWMLVMKKRRFVFLALFIFAISPAIYSQDSIGSDAGGYQQQTNGDCTDPMSSSEAGCTPGLEPSLQPQAQQSQGRQQQGETLQQYNLERPGMPRSLGTSGMESTPLTGQSETRLQQLPVVLPPEQPTEFQRFVAATTGQLLPIYGENLFRNVPTTFAPIDLAPVTADYVIGPDDELRIRVWGQINFSGNVRVDRSGNIYLPQVGEVHVAGLQFSQLDVHLREAVGKIYHNFDLSVDMGRIRSIQVYVTGQARRPGVYTVSSLSSLVDALFASGGPSPQGSLRHILVNRDGTTVADFDLYGLLLHGDKSHDIRLQSEDVLYVPAVGPQVAITGSINTPGIYELREGDTIHDLIEVAGKTSAVASSSRISLERLAGSQNIQAMEFALDESGLSARLLDGDILRIYSIVPAYKKTVTLRGNVANPGRFSWHPGMHLSDLIPDRDSLLSRDYWWKRSHLGLPSLEFEPIITTIGEGQRPLEADKRGLTTYVTQETLMSALTPGNQKDSDNANNAAAKAGQTGSSGAVGSQLTQTPATGELEKSKLNDVRLSAPEIDWNYAVIERIDPDTLKSSLVPFDLGALVLHHDAHQDLALQPGDTVTIFSHADIRVPLEAQVKYVKLEGEFAHPGFYSVLPGETLHDLVARAGGLTPKAYLYGSEFTRESTRVLQQERLDEYVSEIGMESERGTQALAMSGLSSASSAVDVSASRAASAGLISRLSQVKATGRIVLQFKPTDSSIEDIPPMSLQNGDKFVVPYPPSTVNVIGAVYDQNSFLYEPGQLVSHYLKIAGGPNRNADSKHSFVVRADGSVVSKAVAKNSSFWGKGFNELHLNPGDTIIIPDKTLRPTALRNFMDWSQIFSQLAFGAAAINVL
jgi:protein involved in polysaccharide export with SLBB domain